MNEQQKRLAIEEIKQILDESLQRCQEYSYKDWSSIGVQELIIKVKELLNRVPLVSGEEEKG